MKRRWLHLSREAVNALGAVANTAAALQRFHTGGRYLGRRRERPPADLRAQRSIHADRPAPAEDGHRHNANVSNFQKQ